MKVIKPTAFLSSMLVSTTATEPASVWNSATAYSLNNVVQLNNRLYRAIAAGTNQNPETAFAFWVDVGPTNPYAMFDRTVSYSTTDVTSLTVVIAPGRVNAIALINLIADTVSVVIRDGLSGPIVYENEVGVSAAIIDDWYDYFYEDPLRKRTQILFSDIPTFPNAHVTLTLTSATSQPVALAEYIFGMLTELGTTQYGATSGIVDYSRKVTDDFGNVTFIERPYSKRMSATVDVRNTQLNNVQQLMYSLRATPAVWVASSDPFYEEALFVYGFYRDFSTVISYPSHSQMQLDIEGLT